MTHWFLVFAASAQAGRSPCHPLTPAFERAHAEHRIAQPVTVEEWSICGTPGGDFEVSERSWLLQVSPRADGPAWVNWSQPAR